MTMQASEKQVAYAASLLRRNGFSDRWMGREFAALGAGMRQCSGTVRGWLEGMTNGEISALIDRLLGMLPPKGEAG